MRTSGVVRCLVGFLVLVAAATAQADVTGTVFRDGDFDGSRDAGETGFGGVTVPAVHNSPAAVGGTLHIGGPLSVVPEPTTVLLLGGGAVAVALSRLRRRASPGASK